MAEDHDKGPEFQPIYPNIESAYQDVMGFPFPEKPSDLQPQIMLPPKALGGFVDAVIAQELDDPRLSKGQARERSQLVGLLTNKGELEDSRVVIGTPSRTALADAWLKLGRWIPPLIGKSPKFLTYWHTHTSKYGSHLSTSDAAQRTSEDTKAMVYLLGAPDGITAVFQTQTAIPKTIPFSTFRNTVAAYDKLIWFYDSSVDNPDVSALAKFFEDRGYVLYAWPKPKATDTVRRAHERGDFMEGIPLTRIGKPLWLRLLTKEPKK